MAGAAGAPGAPGAPAEGATAGEEAEGEAVFSAADRKIQMQGIRRV